MSNSNTSPERDASFLKLLLKLPVEKEIERRARMVELERIKRNAFQIRARCKTLVGFIREAWSVVEPDPRKKYIHGWHIDAICKHLEAITFGKLLDLGLENRLLINVPPGTMKSLILNVFWPAWEWGPCSLPYLRYISTSYIDDLTTRDSRRCRNLIQSDWYQSLWPEIKLVRTGETSFENDKGGWRESCPFGSLTGKRGDRVLIDDPHSVKTAESEAERKSVTLVFREAVPNRMDNPTTSAIVIIMQRLHSDDVSGVIEQLSLPYVHLMLPMEFEEERRCTTPLFTDPRSYDGELLFPERFPRAVLDRDYVPLGPYGVAGQYQQRPSPRGGGLFQRSDFEPIDALPAGPHETIRGWDFGGTDRKKNPNASYTAGVKLSEYPDGTLVIEHIVRGQWAADKVESVLVNTAAQDGYVVAQDIPQDPGQAGKAQVRYLVMALRGYTVRWSTESGEKAIRADPIAAQVRVGNVKILKGPWNAAFLDEVESFPAGTWKDQVDALSRAYTRLTQNKRMGGVPVAPEILTPDRGGHFNGAVA